MGGKVSLKNTFAQISPLLCLFKRHALLPCTFAFQFSKILPPPSKVTIPKYLFFFKRSNIVHSLKCIYKNGSREVASTEVPHRELPLGNLQRESPLDNCLHKTYITRQAGCKALTLS